MEAAVATKEKATGRRPRLSAEDQDTLYIASKADDFHLLDTQFMRKKCGMVKEGDWKLGTFTHACGCGAIPSLGQIGTVIN